MLSNAREEIVGHVAAVLDFLGPEEVLDVGPAIALFSGGDGGESCVFRFRDDHEVAKAEFGRASGYLAFDHAIHRMFSDFGTHRALEVGEHHQFHRGLRISEYQFFFRDAVEQFFDLLGGFQFFAFPTDFLRFPFAALARALEEFFERDIGIGGAIEPDLGFAEGGRVLRRVEIRGQPGNCFDLFFE